MSVFVTKHIMKQTHYKKGAATAWTIGVIAVVALIIAWLAFNRSGEDLLPTAAEETNEARVEAQMALENAAVEAREAAEDASEEAAIAVARAEARAELLALRARVEAEEGYAEVAADIETIETDLERAYANASAKARAEYNEFEAELAEFETALRDGTGDALELLGGLILMLETDVRTDESEMNASAEATTSTY